MSRRRRYDTAPFDEIGVPADALAQCPDCRQWYPADGWHRCETNEVGDPPE